MTVETINAVYRYFETLYDLNRNLITLCGVDVLDNAGQFEKYVEEVIHAVPRLVPYAFDVKEEGYRIVKKDGLMEFSAEFPLLSNGYEDILKKHYSFLANIKRIRNKFEHKMHGVVLVGNGSGSVVLFETTYEIDEKVVTLKAEDIIAFVKDMNTMFFDIQRKVYKFAVEHEEDGIRQPFYRKLLRYYFSDFNKIYESNLLRVFGKALLPF